MHHTDADCRVTRCWLRRRPCTVFTGIARHHRQQLASQAKHYAAGEQRPSGAAGAVVDGRRHLRLRLDRRRGIGDRRQRRHHALGREGDDDFGADAQLRFERERAAMQVDQVLGDRQAEAGALFGGFDRVRALAERGQHDRDFLLGDAGAGVLDAHVLAARGGPADFEPDLAALRRELDGVGQKVEADLPHRALVAPQPRQVGLEHFVDGDAAIAGAQLQQMMAILDHAVERDRFLVELVAAGLDARQIEDLVDEVEKVHAGIMDVAGVVLVRRHAVRPENLGLHHLGKTQDGVERRAQLVAHLGEEARLGDIGGFGAAARFVGDRFRLLELADQRVLFGARFQRRQRRRIEPVGEQREIAFGGQRHDGEDVIVQRSLDREIERDRDGDRQRQREHRDRQARGQHARDRHHQQHDEQHEGGRPARRGRSD